MILAVIMYPCNIKKYEQYLDLFWNMSEINLRSMPYSFQFRGIMLLFTIGPSIFCTSFKNHIWISLFANNYCLYFHYTSWKQRNGWDKHVHKEVLLLFRLWDTFLLGFLLLCIYIQKIGITDTTELLLSGIWILLHHGWHFRLSIC
jgi:hypothetical protein